MLVRQGVVVIERPPSCFAYDTEDSRGWRDLAHEEKHVYAGRKTQTLTTFRSPGHRRKD